MTTRYEDYLFTDTLHYSEIVWWWVEDKVFDADYHFKVYDAIHAKIKEIELNTGYDVWDDRNYRCQFEGVQLVGRNAEHVRAVGKDLARTLARFKGIVPLNYRINARKEAQLCGSKSTPT